MKLLGKVLLSLLVGAVCVYFVLRNMDINATAGVLKTLPVSAVVLYLLTMIPTHLFRAWRWKYLLRPLGVSMSFGRLMVISTVGFMAILALPVRLGEFVRPYYVVRDGQSRMSAILGTVAVERIVDGLMISILFFTTYMLAFRGAGSGYSPVLAGAAWLSLLGFLALTVFLACALRWTEPTTRFVRAATLLVVRFTSTCARAMAAIRLSFAARILNRLSPSAADQVADKVRALIQGFRALREPRDMVPFLFQTLLYWGANGFGMWLLARDMNLAIPITAAYAAMAFTGVLISLPNSPGLVGQFHAGVMIALGAYVSEATVRSFGVAYAVALHGIQFVWYVGLGCVALLVAGGKGSLRQMVIESKRAAEGGRP